LASDLGFINFLKGEAAVYGISLNRLTLEVVEHTPAFNGVAFQHALEQLRALGVRIALDDIGLGSSNYKMMLDCRPDYFKVDKYLIQGCHRDLHRKAVVKSVATLGESLGSHVVAEGVEQLEDLETVTDLGIALLQGYLFGKPMPVSTLLSTELLQLHRQGYSSALPTIKEKVYERAGV
jgi:EAL domain-containing protein (putative c-di-GMP-specific phosphodiesterase class I)